MNFGTLIYVICATVYGSPGISIINPVPLCEVFSGPENVLAQRLNELKTPYSLVDLYSTKKVFYMVSYASVTVSMPKILISTSPALTLDMIEPNIPVNP